MLSLSFRRMWELQLHFVGYQILQVDLHWGSWLEFCACDEETVSGSQLRLA